MRRQRIKHKATFEERLAAEATLPQPMRVCRTPPFQPEQSNGQLTEVISVRANRKPAGPLEHISCLPSQQ
jgi:hypothetical protein